MRLDDSRRAPLLLFWLSTLETAALPIAFELLLGPHMLRHPQRAWLAATWATAGSLLGALVVYFIGMVAYDRLGFWLVTAFDFQEEMSATWMLFREHGFWAIVIIGLTPVPYHFALLIAGAARYPVPMLILAGFLARGTRYYLLAWLVKKYGDAALQLWRRQRVLAVVLVLLIMAGGIAATVWFGQEVQEIVEENGS